MLLTPETDPSTDQGNDCPNVQFGESMSFFFKLGLLNGITNEWLVTRSAQGVGEVNKSQRSDFTASQPHNRTQLNTTTLQLSSQ